MPSPLPSPVKRYAVLLFIVVLAGCQPGSNPRPVPSVAQIGSNLKCPSGDRGFEDTQAGWGFCYPVGWLYHERAQGSQKPPGLDLAFDITYAPATPAPCSSPVGIAGSPHPNATPCSGDFAFMIISTYERGGSNDLAGWIAANLNPLSPSPSGSPLSSPSTSASPSSSPASLESISWGNAVEAGRLPDGRRIALTPHHVVILDLHSGLLDLESAMSTRLGTWKFTY
jgi:hypothetical protein